MTKMIRRHALRTLGGGSLAAVLFSGNEASATEPAKGDGNALVQGTLTLEHAEGRRLRGFIETGVREGIAFCSLVRQHPENPAVESVFAEPEQMGSRSGVRVTVALYSPPVGEVTFSLLHLTAQA